jgi:septal ring factor EnvC (AmiA/AmiB activator)
VRRGRAAAALLLALAAPALGEADPRAAELEALRRAIEQHRDRIEAFEREERGLLETLEETDRALEALGRDAADARREAADARAELARLEAEAARTEHRLARTRKALGARAVALYKAGELGPAAALFAATSLREALERAALLQRLLDQDRALLRRFREEQRALETAREAAAKASAARDAAVARFDRRADEIARERGGRQRVLAALRSDRRRERAALAELEAAARALEETLAALQQAPPGAPLPPSAVPFPSLRGLLDPPVDAPLAARFGRVVDEFGTETFRKGVEFAAPRGAPVRGVADGVVRFAGWFRGYGKIVILDHGGAWYTVSGHLDEVGVAVGDAVERGAPIGRAGDTGSLAGPQLYFEIRRGGEAVDPADWLRGGGGR